MYLGLLLVGLLYAGLYYILGLQMMSPRLGFAKFV